VIGKHWTVIALLALTAAAFSAMVPETSSADGGPVALLAERAPAGFSDGGDGVIAVWATPAPPEMPVVPGGGGE